MNSNYDYDYTVWQITSYITSTQIAVATVFLYLANIEGNSSAVWLPLRLLDLKLPKRE